MSKKLRFSLILVMICAICGCDVFSSNKFQYFRYAIEISLQVDGVSVTGRSVQELRAEAQETGIFGSNGVISHVRGQAVTLKVPSRGAVLALMLSPNGADAFDNFVMSQCGLDARVRESPRNWADRIGQFSGECILAPPQVPLLVWVPEKNTQTGTAVVRIGDISTNTDVPTVKWLGGSITATDDPVSFDNDPTPTWLKLLPPGTPPIEVPGGPRPVKLFGFEFQRDRFP